MKKYLQIIFAAFVVALMVSCPMVIEAQTPKTISYDELRPLVTALIEKDAKNDPAHFQQMEAEAKKIGTTAAELYIKEAIKILHSEGITVIGFSDETDDTSSMLSSHNYTMPEDLNAWFKAKGLYSPSKYTKNYYWTMYVNGDDTAIDLSNKLELPLDSIHQMAVTFVRDNGRYNKKFRSVTLAEEKELNEFFSSPYPTLKTVKRENTLSVSQFHFPQDRNLRIKPVEPYLGEVNFADNLETYNGEFSFRWSSNVKYNHPGIVKYTYIPRSDGSRIFEGKFEYNREAKSVYPYTEIEYAKIVGQMKNNKMVGHWEFELETEGKLIMSIDFDIDGKLHGEVVRGSYHALFNHGTISEVYWHNGVFQTHGKFDSYGQPVGTWEIKRKNKPTIIVKYDNVGRRISCGYRNDSTGDWYETGNYNFVTDIPKEISFDVNAYLLRDTPEYTPKRDNVN